MMRYLCLLVLVSLASTAQAHQLSTAYLDATVDSTGQVELQWQARFYDWERAVGLDQDRNGELQWGEVLNGAERLEQYAQQNLIVARGDHKCQLAFSGPWKTEQHFREGYLVLPMRAQCPLAGELTLRYHAFFEQQRDHKLIVTVDHEGAERPGSAHTRLIHEDQPLIAVSDAGGSLLKTVVEFVKEGVIHIWIGLDHILFLLSLLLTCVLVRRRGAWQSESNTRRVVSNTFWVVTAFTLAHSVTLTATALGWVTPSSQWVEVVIAVSVALAALNNLYPIIRRLSWMTFVFGLIHGFGFAGVLGELGVPADQAVPSVLAFNLGVEIGQLSIVLLILPLLMAARNYRWYSKVVMPALSLIVALVAILWVIERV
ncbi:HupE/UreJ family protein [Marinimicrobium agarilyticum]|uniref:HupE/UreJ family protein n=1 Tax=Marinimicrobium agarilyticum TaxID=306546 RepID=UPI000422E337|nr:HupE/UreJ family protein [Marinimicrobium agarilyticum]